MCRAISEGGRRCPGCFDPIQRGLANIRQRIGRHDRNARKAADRADWDRETHYVALLERAIGDYECATGGPAVGQAPPTRAKQYTPEATVHWSDDDLSAELNRVHDDPAAVDQILSTLDWREQMERQRDANIAADLDRKRHEKAEREAAWLREWEDSSPLTNPSRRSSRRLKPEQVCREEYDAHLYTSYLQAENDCRGVLLSRAGRAHGVNPETLFSGPASRVRKYGSEELKTWFGRHGRITYAEWRYEWFGRDSDRKAARTAQHQSIGEVTA
ncbi:hypothetical protein KIPE111705_07105 [Kibdelosporangium persicum]|uniref:Uncharacterized protein n=1 Tax=Kibdelosporangium persicum TaxID=2698649 RepID=A0ABX2FJA5_9PSEU|nr:hypothetical protein [Kibdelosporangium persicum]NRN70828.1 hypothetical protein [Kibdelosporangium persicum]